MKRSRIFALHMHLRVFVIHSRFYRGGFPFIKLKGFPFCPCDASQNGNLPSKTYVITIFYQTLFWSFKINFFRFFFSVMSSLSLRDHNSTMSHMSAILCASFPLKSPYIEYDSECLSDEQKFIPVMSSSNKVVINKLARFVHDVFKHGISST